MDAHSTRSYGSDSLPSTTAKYLVRRLAQYAVRLLSGLNTRPMPTSSYFFCSTPSTATNSFPSSFIHTAVCTLLGLKNDSLEGPVHSTLSYRLPSTPSSTVNHFLRLRSYAGYTTCLLSGLNSTLPTLAYSGPCSPSTTIDWPLPPFESIE